MKFNRSSRSWEHMSPMAGHPFLADLSCDLGVATPTGFGVKFAVAGDFDGDGQEELIVAPATTGSAGNDLWAMRYPQKRIFWNEFARERRLLT